MSNNKAEREEEVEVIDCSNEEYKEKILTNLMNMECTYLKSDKSLELKSAEYWGMLVLANSLNIIAWDRVMYLFGEFTSKAMKLR